MKETKKAETEILFNGTRINITCERRKLLGYVVGAEAFVRSYVEKEIEVLKSKLAKISEIAKT